MKESPLGPESSLATDYHMDIVITAVAAVICGPEFLIRSPPGGRVIGRLLADRMLRRPMALLGFERRKQTTCRSRLALIWSKDIGLDDRHDKPVRRRRVAAVRPLPSEGWRVASLRRQA
ncbi:hypothetical protein AGR4C_pa60087 [Agrobacterium tumefaciens str. Kerr 14]|uniref:Uncharacterized protein n=1 Tax=Agrobacterium tumefaciens str. Kerr 14 TaxID=1183424 RepID=A0A1S7SCE3_AGRTU|nr:hypothetical protein AGR4C_pa60087 [Agrobacterium tumefaciens str. Kerr 14]